MVELSNPKRGVEDDTQGNQDGDDQASTALMFRNIR